MRVIAGTARSLPLKTPQGLDTRPTTDRIKETLFNILQNDIPGCVFVDMFSGSGGIGIEALSRGARKAYFIENAKEPLDCIAHNLRFTRFEDRAVILKQDAVAALSGIHEEEVDLFFLDPPYGQEQERRVLEALRGMRYVTENTLIVVETARNTSMEYVQEMGFFIAREKIYKTNKHIFIKKEEDSL